MAKDTGMATLAHILALFTGFLGPLIIMLAADDDFAEQNARNALNFQIMVNVVGIILGVLSLTIILMILTLPLLLILGVLHLVFCVIAAAKANNGEAWKYPLTPDIV
jgi:uncharacterized Tic20 family protein